MNLRDSLALEELAAMERLGLEPTQLPCSACGSWIPASATVCPECDADPAAESDPCGDCEGAGVLPGSRFGGIGVDVTGCRSCRGRGEFSRSGYGPRADLIRARKLRASEGVSRAA